MSSHISGIINFNLMSADHLVGVHSYAGAYGAQLLFWPKEARVKV